MKYISTFLMMLCAAITLQAENLKILPADPSVKSGVLPNGMAYYVAANPAYKGIADFVLVQKVGTSTVPELSRGDVLKLSQSSLASCYHESMPSVQEFFVSHGVVPGRNGYIQVSEDATVYRFNDVHLDNTAVLDSTLLVLVGMVEKSRSNAAERVGEWYAPSDHALIVAGDVNGSQVVEKIKMLSYMSQFSESLPRREYRWTEQDTICVENKVDSNGRLSVVSAMWRLQRTPLEYMNTVQPIVYDRFMEEFGIVATDRVKNVLRDEGIPVADISYEYLNSVEALGDEVFRLSVSVAGDDLAHTVSVISSVLSDLDEGNATVHEVKRAGHIFMNGLREDIGVSDSNSDYADKCISSFLYNSSLTSRKAVEDFHLSRQLADQEHLDFFNSIVSSSIDGRRNLTLTYEMTDSLVSVGELTDQFTSSWTSDKRSVSDKKDMSEGLRLQGTGEPVKIAGLRKEYMSGGTIWTLSNGFKVIFKHMDTADEIHYSLALNGGYASVSDLYEGEGVYMSDILKLSRIGGAGYDKFMDVLRQNGMTMDFAVGPSTMTIKGRVKSKSLEYFMSVLLTVMKDREIDVEALDYQIRCEPLRYEFMKGSHHERVCIIDSLMCPGYKYSSCRRSLGLSQDFAVKADKYMSEQAEKMNDGALILVGDINEKKLREVLKMYAGGFKTQNRSFARPVVSYQPISGKVLYTGEGDANSVNIAMSVPMSMTADNYYLAAIATMVLQKELSQKVAGTGMFVRLKHNFRKYPQERFNLLVSIEETSVDGFAPGTAYGDPISALNKVRNVLDNPSVLCVSNEYVALCKSLLKNYLAQEKKSPEYWLQTIERRYLDGKDFTTGSDARVDAVTPGKIRNILSSLSNGARVEYIINRR